MRNHATFYVMHGINTAKSWLMPHYRSTYRCNFCMNFILNVPLIPILALIVDYMFRRFGKTHDCNRKTESGTNIIAIRCIRLRLPSDGISKSGETICRQRCNDVDDDDDDDNNNNNNNNIYLFSVNSTEESITSIVVIINVLFCCKPTTFLECSFVKLIPPAVSHVPICNDNIGLIQRSHILQRTFN